MNSELTVITIDYILIDRTFRRECGMRVGVAVIPSGTGDNIPCDQKFLFLLLKDDG